MKLYEFIAERLVSAIVDAKTTQERSALFIYRSTLIEEQTSNYEINNCLLELIACTSNVRIKAILEKFYKQQKLYLSSFSEISHVTIQDKRRGSFFKNCQITGEFTKCFLCTVFYDDGWSNELFVNKELALKLSR